MKRWATNARWRKLTPRHVRRIRAAVAAGDTFASLGRQYAVTAQTIANVARGDVYRAVGGPRAPAPRGDDR